MDTVNAIKELSALHGVSGYEHRISDEIARMFSKICSRVEKDNLGNVKATMACGKDNAPTVMVEAHMDEIGFMITDIDDKGFLYFTPIGGVDYRILLAKEVIVHGKEDIVGIVGAKPPHVTTAEDRAKAVKAEDMYIDTLCSADYVRSNVCVGDTVTFADSFCPFGDKYVSAKSQDDRTGIAVLLSVMEKLKDKKLNFDVCLCACVQEEVGRRGAGTMAFGTDPVFAVSIDVCHAKTPDSSEGVFPSGEGTVISRGPNIHPTLYQRAVKIMDENKIPYNVDVDGGDTGTDAWAIQTAKMGIPTLLFSLPLKYMHTMVETVHLDDVEATANAIAELILSTEDAEVAVCLD